MRRIAHTERATQSWRVNGSWGNTFSIQVPIKNSGRRPPKKSATEWLPISKLSMCHRRAVGSRSRTSIGSFPVGSADEPIRETPSGFHQFCRTSLPTKHAEDAALRGEPLEVVGNLAVSLNETPIGGQQAALHDFTRTRASKKQVA